MTPSAPVQLFDDLVVVDGRDIPVRNLDKQLGSAKAPWTRRNTIEYYLEMAPVILPYLQDRRLTGVRYPGGVHKSGIYLKRIVGECPPWVQIAPDPTDDNKPGYVSVADRATLVWLASTDVLEMHVPLSRTTSPDEVAEIMLDLDPGAGCGLADCANLAELLVTTFELGESVRYKTSGKSGLHLLVELDGVVEVVAAAAHARKIAEAACERWPALAVANPGKSNRIGKVYVDWQQNLRHRTTIAPYSLRCGANGVQVSTPITTDELSVVENYTPNTVLDRVRARGDVYMHDRRSNTA